jgi:hypothetical protein
VSINGRIERRTRLLVVWALRFGVLALAGSAGCSSTAPTEGDHAGAGGQSSAEAGQAGLGGGVSDAGARSADAGASTAGEGGEGGEGGDAGLSMLDAPWNDHSQHLELRCFAFFSGSMEFSAERAQLSAEQLQLLDGLRRVPSNEQCVSDLMGCSVAIMSDRGDAIEYVAQEDDALCGESKPTLAYASVAPLLDTLGCKFAQESAPTLFPSATCFHGLFSSGASVIHQTLTLPKAKRSYHFELDDCASKNRAGRVTLELFGEDPSQPIAVGTPVAAGPRGACLAFDFETQAPITADLVISTTDSFGPGDFYLNFR